MPGNSLELNGRNGLHGLPAQTILAGKLELTILPAPTTVFSPMETPLRIIQLAPIQTLSPILTGLALTSPSFR